MIDMAVVGNTVAEYKIDIVVVVVVEFAVAAVVFVAVVAVFVAAAVVFAVVVVEFVVVVAASFSVLIFVAESFVAVVF